MSADKPKYAQPPLARGGLFAEPNFKPRLADRLGSLNTQYGVAEHWAKDIAPVFYPHVANPLAIGAMPPPVQKVQGKGEKTLVEDPGAMTLVMGDEPQGASGPAPLTPASSVRGKTVLGPQEGLLEPEAAVAPTARYGLTEVGGPGEVPQEPVQVIEASGATVAAAEPEQAPVAPTEAPGEPTDPISVLGSATETFKEAVGEAAGDFSDVVGTMIQAPGPKAPEEPVEYDPSQVWGAEEA